MFESMEHSDLHIEIKQLNAALTLTPKNKITLIFQSVQKQLHCNNCRAFAIAFSTSLCHAANPSSFFVLSGFTETILTHWFVSGIMEPFLAKGPGKNLNDPTAMFNIMQAHERG